MSQGLITDKAKQSSAPAVDKSEKDVGESPSNGGEAMDFEEGEIDEEQEPDENLDGESLVHPNDVKISVPPGHVWRLGPATGKASSIIMRFATVDDRKIPRAERRSAYYRKYGNPNFEG
jgi:hypothetical protein